MRRHVCAKNNATSDSEIHLGPDFFHKWPLTASCDPRYFRPAELETLLGDAGKARKQLGWTPRTQFTELVAEVVREDLKSAERDELVTHHGYTAYQRNE
jgi:GDPmannose 4,6-dehydratase